MHHLRLSVKSYNYSKVKMTDLDILHSLKWYNILHCLSEVLIIFKLPKTKQMSYVHINFPDNFKKVVCTTNVQLSSNYHYILKVKIAYIPVLH